MALRPREQPTIQGRPYDGAVRLGVMYTSHMDPGITAHITEVLARWSYADISLTNLITTILGTRYVTVARMMSGLRSARRFAIEAAGSGLDGIDGENFRTVMRHVDKFRAIRDRYAHHLWGIPDNSDGLVLVTPAALSESLAHYRELEASTHNLSDEEAETVLLGFSATIAPEDKRLFTAEDIENHADYARYVQHYVRLLDWSLDPTGRLVEQGRSLLDGWLRGTGLQHTP